MRSNFQPHIYLHLCVIPSIFITLLLLPLPTGTNWFGAYHLGISINTQHVYMIKKLYFLAEKLLTSPLVR